jgi:hypothetical protein
MPETRSGQPPPRTNDPEGILLFGICEIAARIGDGRSYTIMDAVGANEFAKEILLLYWKAKALTNS